MKFGPIATNNVSYTDHIGMCRNKWVSYTPLWLFESYVQFPGASRVIENPETITMADC